MRIGALLLTAVLLGVTSLTAQQSPAAHEKPAARKATVENTAAVNSGSQPALLSAAVDSVPDSTAQKPKGKGGLWGKAKKLAKNKVVQTVAKTAACTMVPGGQAIAGAIDAAAANSAGEAAQGAAHAATGSSCMPGMGGAGMDGAGLAGMGGGRMAGTAGMAGANALPALVGSAVAMPGGMSISAAQLQEMQLMAGTSAGGAGPAGPGAMGMLPDEAETASCLDVTVEDYRQFSDPTGGVNRPMTKAEMKQQAKIGKRIQGRQQACAMQQMAQAMAMSQQAMVTSQQRMAAANSDVMTEAPGKQPALAADLVAELKKGKTTVRDIDWVAGGGSVSEAGMPAFSAAMATLAGAMHEAGGSYRIDIYMDQRYGDTEVKTLSPSRIAAVLQAIQSAPDNSPVAVKTGAAKKHKDPRLEIVRVGGR
jgi:hypothetical protein